MKNICDSQYFLNSTLNRFEMLQALVYVGIKGNVLFFTVSYFPVFCALLPV